MQQKIQKSFFVSEIIASELVSLNCLYEETDTFRRQPMCYKAVPRFCMSIRETFADSTDLAVINKFDKRPVMHISTVLGHVYHVACRRDLSNGSF